jgi:hypothetical protein
MSSTSASNAVLTEKWSVLEIKVSRWSQGLPISRTLCYKGVTQCKAPQKKKIYFSFFPNIPSGYSLENNVGHFEK